MADYEKRYALVQAPQARQDGSGCVDHDILAQARRADDPEASWLSIPGRHKTFSVPATELAAALGSGTVGQKVQAYKQALASNMNTQPQPINGWAIDQLEALLDANDIAQMAATAAQEFIAQVVPGGYPVTFTI